MTDKKQRPQDRWDEKAGMAAKTYKVRKADAEAFAEICKENKIAMGIKLSDLMRQYVEENKQ